MTTHSMARKARWLLLFVLLAAGMTAHAQAVQDDCSPPHRIEWPADHPVWSLCWSTPEDSSGIDGSGLELRDVSYKGKLVLRRAGLPLLNVNYDPGGCGSYRDWQHGSAPFETDDILGPPEWHYAEPTSSPRTMCDHVGKDAGGFEGVAAEKTPEQLVLTTQLQSGPYRYTQKWTFHLDGSMDARVAFTSIVDPCNVEPHGHHAYWRLEFGIGGDGKDYAEESQTTSRWTRFRTETSRKNDPIRGGDWREGNTMWTQDPAPHNEVTRLFLLQTTALPTPGRWPISGSWRLIPTNSMTEAPGKGPGEAPCSLIIISMASEWTAPIWFCGFTQPTVTNTVAGVISSAPRFVRLESGRTPFNSLEVDYVETFPLLLADPRLFDHSFCTAPARNQAPATVDGSSGTPGSGVGAQPNTGPKCRAADQTNKSTCSLCLLRQEAVVRSSTRSQPVVGLHRTNRHYHAKEQQRWWAVDESGRGDLEPDRRGHCSTKH